MRSLARHLLAVAALPLVVAVLVPAWLARQDGIEVAIAAGTAARLVQLAGLLLLGVGLVLFASSLRRFAGEGEGTLAPWDPPRRLVVRGPYRYVRNPMIAGVVLVLFGESLVLWSLPLLEWALFVAAINLVYIPLVEEPGLEDRFGEPYREYCRHVPRLVPRLRPWEPPAGSR